MGPKVSLALKFGVMAGLLGLLYKSGAFDAARWAALASRPDILGIIILIFACGVLAGAMRLGWMLSAQGLILPYPDLLRHNLVGIFFSLSLPGSVSGDFVKGYRIARGRPGMEAGVAVSLLLDRLVGMAGLAFICGSGFLASALGFFGAGLGRWNTPVGLAAGTAVLASISAPWLTSVASKLLSSRTHPRLARLQSLLGSLDASMEAARARPALLAKGFALSVAIHASTVIVFLLCATAFRGFEAVPAGLFFSVVPAGLMVSAVPVAPGGLGTGHAAFHLLFKALGAEGGADLFSSLAALQVLAALIGALLFLQDSARARP